jgi:hypothetical protein
MKKLFLVPTILSFAAIALAGQADARPGDCIKGAIVGGIVGSLCRARRHRGRRWLCLWNTQAERLRGPFELPTAWRRWAAQ